MERYRLPSKRNRLPKGICALPHWWEGSLSLKRSMEDDDRGFPCWLGISYVLKATGMPSKHRKCRESGNDLQKSHPLWCPSIWNRRIAQTKSFPTPGLGHSLPVAPARKGDTQKKGVSSVEARHPCWVGLKGNQGVRPVCVLPVCSPTPTHTHASTARRAPSERVAEVSRGLNGFGQLTWV